ncbi:MAG TPA: hypothetical protein VG893_02005 [Terracidiphilus sp.]|nr:hypothetical protein [Terracidiphilus sp.]
MRIASPSHAVFAVTVAALGILGLIQGSFTPLWEPVPAAVPARLALVYLAAIVSLASGLGLLFRSTAAPAARLLLGWLLLWMLLFRLPGLFVPPLFGALWAIAPTAVLTAAAWALWIEFATEWDRQRLGFFAGASGLRLAHGLYALALIFFGAAHFIDPADTLALIPRWLPWHLFWAYFFGCTFIAAGLGLLLGVYARLAAALATLQIALFLALVWIPLAATRSLGAFQTGEAILTAILMAAAWVVAGSCRTTPWLAARNR